MSDLDAAERTADGRELFAQAVAHHRGGRVDVAERLCHEILDLLPEQPDALLMLGILAQQAGRYAAAIGFVERAIAARPLFPLACFTLGNLLRDQGRLDDATGAYSRAATLKPDFADAHIGLGRVLRRRAKPAEAENAFRRAEALRPGHAPLQVSLGNVLADQGRLDDAEAAYAKAIVLDPDYAEAHINLGNLKLDLLELGDAEACYLKAIAIRPDLAQAHNNLGNALRDQERLDEAARAYEKAIAISPDLVEAYFNLGNTRYEQGRFDAAAATYRKAIDRRPDYAKPHHGLANLFLARGEAAAAVNACDDCLRTDPGNRQALAIKAAALDELGEREAARRLMDFDRLVRPRQLAAPDGFPDLAAFNAALAHHALTHPTLNYEPLNKATRFGRQTRELLVEPKGPVALLETMIEEEVDRYMRALPDDRGHPFVATPPRRWRLNIWATVLEALGHQTVHIHPSGWLSGVYYVRLPAVIDADDAEHAGWIEFGRPPPDFNCTVAPDVRLVRPEEGLMVLFPSYIYHRTVPFESDEIRISIAFDILPTD